jgi:TrmH family RNA methyltransferase
MLPINGTKPKLSQPAESKRREGLARRAVAASEKTITSRENRWLKMFRRVLRSSEGLEDGCIGVEGVRLVEEALRSGLEVPALLVSPAGERHLSRLAPWLNQRGRLAIPLLRTSERLFATVAQTKTPQGLAALVELPMDSFDDLLRAAIPLVVVLVGVQDPGNVGTIVRSAEAFGATGVVACRGTANPLAPKAVRASAGSALRLPIMVGMAVSVLLAQLRVAGVKIFAASLSGGLSPGRAALRDATAILIGNEGAGLPAEVERSADAMIHIPLAAAIDSLNAAVAASVLLYEAARQRAALP